MLTNREIVGILPVIFVAALVGCGDPTSSDGPHTPNNNLGKDAPSTAGKESAASKSAADDTSGLKDLDAADRKLAEQQKVCPVSGNPLGSMGKPYKMTVKGRVVFLCCDGCKDEVDKDPDGILKKLDGQLEKK